MSKNIQLFLGTLNAIIDGLELRRRGPGPGLTHVTVQLFLCTWPRRDS